jgi:hypothetical protein
MSNAFYNYVTGVTPGSVIRSDKYNSDQQAIDSGFELVEGVLNRTLQLPVDFAGDNTLPSLENDSFIYIDASGDFKFYVKSVFDGHVSDVEGWHADVQSWVAETEGYKNSAQDSAAAAAGYVAAVGVPAIVNNGGVLNVSEGLSAINIICLGNATINLPSSPGASAYYAIKSTSEAGVVTINTNAGANDHQIDLDDGNTDYSGTLTGKYQLELYWLGAGIYRGF